MSDERHSFEREQALQRQPSALPAATYNLRLKLLSASANGCVFVPLRSMQYLAVIDAEEIIFVDSLHKRWVEVAWQHFRPQSRSALHEPVPYETVYYTANGAEIQRRLQSEFHAALLLLTGRRQPPSNAGRVLPWKSKA